MNVGKWKERLINDFKKKEFAPIKVLFFLVFGANVSLIPFLTLQARSLGIKEDEVGIIYSFIPIASLIAPPLSGMLADRIGNFKILLSVVTASAGLAGLLFLLVPPARAIHTLPNVLPIDIYCSSTIGANLKVAPPYTCEPELSIDVFPIQVEECSVSCFFTKKLKTKMNKRIPEPNLSCRNSTNCFAGHKYSVETNTSNNFLVEKAFISPDDPISAMKIIITRLNATYDNETFDSDRFLCPSLGSMYNSGDNCVSKCRAKAIREQVCMNKQSIEELNPSLTFYSHLGIRLFKEFTLATSMPLLEGAAVTILRQHKGDFGFQRMFCNVGMMVMTPISGTLIDYYSKANGIEDFRPAMYMYCALKIIAAVIILFLNLNFKKASSKVISDFSSMMLNPEIICFLLATFLAGTCFGYIETFLFWLLQDLGADKKLMGITVTIGSIFGIPLLMVSTFIIKRLGHVNTIIMGFCVYVVRLFGYTMISSPWWAMPFEALECVTVSLMVVSFVSYASILASPTTVVTLQGMYGGLYNGVGRGAGSLIGGFLIQKLGIFKTFRIIAAIGGCSGAVYFVVNFLLFRKNRHIRKEAELEAKKLEKINEVVEKQSTEFVEPQFTRIDSLKKNECTTQDGKLEITPPSKINAAFVGDSNI